MMRHDPGFTVVELMVAVSLMLTVTAAVFALVNPAEGSFSVEPELADMQQRLRVASDALTTDLVMAGAGASSGTQPGSLIYFFPAVLPYRVGVNGQDPPGTFRPDTITLMYVPNTRAQTSVRDALPADASALTVNPEPGCPFDPQTGRVAPLCDFHEGATVAIYGATGDFDTFTVTIVQDNSCTLQHNPNKLSTAYPANSKLVEIASHTYYLKSDAATNTRQLVHYDGGSGADMPVVDHVAGLAFDYFGDPAPPIMKRPLVANPPEPLTTYGPAPAVPLPPATSTGNCLFDGSPAPQPLLPNLAPDSGTLVRLTDGQLTDGPWCPNDASPNRWDADLLRIRKIAVTLRIEAALDALRGPASALFVRSGTSNSAMRYAPDQEVRLQVTPRNLNIGR